MKTIQSILYATDFSPQSRAAFPLAVALARDYSAKLLIAHVKPIVLATYAMGEAAVIEPESSPEEIRERLRQFDAKDRRVQVE